MQIKNLSIYTYFLILLFNSCNNQNKLESDIESEVQTSDSISLSNNNHNYTIGDSIIKLKISNNTSYQISYGDKYSIEQFNSTTKHWNDINFRANIVYPLTKHILLSGGTGNITIYLYPKFYDYIPGDYRISKEITINDTTRVYYFYFSLK